MAMAYAAAAAAEEASKALVGGLLVEVNDDVFMNWAAQHRDRICVSGEVGTIRKKTLYAFSIDGLVIMTKTDRQISIPNKTIHAREVSVPSV